jgi:hypothetical protein
MPMAEDADDAPATRRARLKAQRRARKRDPDRMRVTGKGVFLLQRLTQERATRARQRLQRRRSEGG